MTTDTDVDLEDVEAEEAEDEEEEAPAKSGTRFDLPQGVSTPIQLQHYLIRKKLVPKSFRPQTVYGWVKNPGKADPFPVKHYTEDGTAHKKVQEDESGHATSRPGVVLAEAVEWFKRRNKRMTEAEEEKKKEKAKKAKDEGDNDDLEDSLEIDGISVEEGEFEDVEAE